MGLRAKAGKRVGSAIGSAVSGTANYFQESPALVAGAMGVMAVAGGMSALKQEPWGDPMATPRLVAKAQISSSFQGNPEMGLRGINSSYYGRPVSTRRGGGGGGSGRAEVPGELVFGLDNSRRGPVV